MFLLKLVCCSHIDKLRIFNISRADTPRVNGGAKVFAIFSEDLFSEPSRTNSGSRESYIVVPIARKNRL